MLHGLTVTRAVRQARCRAVVYVRRCGGPMSPTLPVARRALAPCGPRLRRHRLLPPRRRWAHLLLMLLGGVALWAALQTFSSSLRTVFSPPSSLSERNELSAPSVLIDW
jgi:hypothetical protein